MMSTLAAFQRNLLTISFAGIIDLDGTVLEDPVQYVKHVSATCVVMVDRAVYTLTSPTCSIKGAKLSKNVCACRVAQCLTMNTGLPQHSMLACWGCLT